MLLYCLSNSVNLYCDTFHGTLVLKWIIFVEVFLICKSLCIKVSNVKYLRKEMKKDSIGRDVIQSSRLRLTHKK